MKNKFFKISVILVMILTMTMTNFVFVGSTLISYALDNNNNTNHNNVEFNTYFKNEKGEHVSNLDIVPSNHDTMLYMYLNVRQEGYFNGSISLENNTNFKLVESNNQYVEDIENNTIKLYNITAGTSIEIPVKIEPIQEEIYRMDLLDVESKVTLNGIYKDSSEKDKEISATKNVKLKFVEEATQEDIINQVDIITNKIAKIQGEEKKIVQLSWNIGMKNNSYPIKEIMAKINTPKIEEMEPQVEVQVNLNTMTSYDNKNENGMSQITLTNLETKEGNITWKKSGTENIILTYLYDKNVNLDNITIEPEVKIILHNQKEMTHISKVTMNQEEKDSVVTVAAKSQEDEIYKGKIVAGIDRSYITRTDVEVNLAKVVDKIIVQENESTYTANEVENLANIFYSQTLIEKEQFDKILGENGVITISNSSNQIIGTIDATTQVNENGYMVIDYGDSQTKTIRIQTTAPVAEGMLEINHIKNIKETQNQIVKQSSHIHSTIFYQYNQETERQIENNIKLQDTVTESKISVDTDQLSTVVNNSIEMKITLLSNEEKYDLYENPNFVITLPNQVENINITNISKLYDDNNEFGDTVEYAVDGKKINLALKGKQKNYTSTVEGITLVVEADVQVSKTAATSEEQIVVTYQNANAVTYANNAVANTPIKITAPKEITAVNNIHELSVETIGEEETTEIMLEKGVSARQVEANMELINSNAVAINNVKILGDFPTDNSENNMGIAVTREIQVTGVDNAKVYYSANENATDNMEDAQNGWSENLNGKEAKSYLILMDTVNAQSSVQATYQMTIPENLEYNKIATEGYAVSAINSEMGNEIQVNSTTIAMQTGIGPKVESQIQAVVGTDALKENEIVKNGEVIQYQVKVSNTGTEEATDIKVIGSVPEGTTLVEPMKNYEYTGSAYYQEKTDAKNFTATIQTLKAGETETIKYEVRVNKDVKAGTNITNETEVQYGQAKTKTTITNVTETSNVRVSLKRVTDLSEGKLYVGDNVKYYVIVDNLSDTEQKNVNVQTNLSDNAEVIDLKLITDMKTEDVTDQDLAEAEADVNKDINGNDNTEEEDNNNTEGQDDEIILDNQKELTYQKEINIGNLKANETKVLYYTIKAKATDKIDMSVIAKANNQTSRSNLWEVAVAHYEIEANMTTNTESQFVDIGNEIDYNITLQNKGIGDSRTIQIEDEIPMDLDIQSITVNGEEKEFSGNSNKVRIYASVGAKSTTNITIKTLVSYHEELDAKTIKNVATVLDGEGEELSTTQEITHIIRGNSSRNSSDDENGEGQDSDGGNNNQNNDTQNPEQRNNMIAGLAWLDSDTDGVKDAGETLLSNVTVKLLNVETNEIVKNSEGNEIKSTTNSEGIYLLQNIKNGKYIAIFEYDTAKYGLTTYQASGVPESQNSNAVINELNVNGVTTKVASSDIITVGNTDIANINIGLVELKNFDLKLEKGISRILIQNTSGSTVRQYDNVDMAKVELDAKKVKGSTVLIEYNIKVSNVGEVDGYVKKVVDYMPSDLKFSSELNKDWYQTNGLLYNASLANEKIVAGESKTITLTLTKSMTENNMGLTTNVAEIAEDYNELGLKDSNSTPGNKAKGENDMSTADAIISIRTGGIIYASIVITIIAIGVVVAFIIITKKNQVDEDNIIL